MPYFDHNATTSLHPSARAAWLAAQDDAWQNPASGHRAGARVKALIDRERSRLAELLGCSETALVFTSGATESANAVCAHLAGRTAADAVALLSPAEHYCVRAAAARWFPGRVEWLALDAHGRVAPEALEQRLRSRRVALVAALAANNETGVLQPSAALAALCNGYGVPLVCDAAQWLGKLPAVALGPADFVLGSAHKFGGPKGVGLLRLPGGEGARGFNFIAGGGQQGGRRAGTEDYAAIAALVAALAETPGLVAAGITDRLRWRERFEHDLIAGLPGLQVVGAGADRLWNTVMTILPAGENHRWLTKLDRRGFQVSTSAACTAAQDQSSHVLAALGYPAAAARRALRFSGGWETTEADWLALLAALREVWVELSAA